MYAFRIAVCVLFVLVAGLSPAAAQSTGRLSVSVQGTVLTLGDVDGTNAGIGGRVTFDLSRWAALDGDINFFPSDNMTQALLAGGSIEYRRQRLDGFAGIKAGWRGGRLGVFAKARPGFSQLTDEGMGCTGEVCALILLPRAEYKTEFAFDLGGIVEFYPSQHLVARLDVSDVMINQRSNTPPCSDCTTHNLATRFGVGFRF